MTNAWKAIVGQVVARRGEPTYAAERNALRRGVRSPGQGSALPIVVPFSQGVNLDALVRSVALIAEHTGAPHVPGQTFGRAMSVLTRKRTGGWPTTSIAGRDGIARRVSTLFSLDLETAVKEINALLGFAASEGIGVDYYSLTSTLLGWGEGIDDESERTRRSIIVDYYTPAYVK